MAGLLTSCMRAPHPAPFQLSAGRLVASFGAQLPSSPAPQSPQLPRSRNASRGLARHRCASWGCTSAACSAASLQPGQLGRLRIAGPRRATPRHAAPCHAMPRRAMPCRAHHGLLMRSTRSPRSPRRQHEAAARRRGSAAAPRRARAWLLRDTRLLAAAVSPLPGLSAHSSAAQPSVTRARRPLDNRQCDRPPRSRRPSHRRDATPAALANPPSGVAARSTLRTLHTLRTLRTEPARQPSVLARCARACPQDCARSRANKQTSKRARVRVRVRARARARGRAFQVFFISLASRHVCTECLAKCATRGAPCGPCAARGTLNP